MIGKEKSLYRVFFFIGSTNANGIEISSEEISGDPNLYTVSNTTKGFEISSLLNAKEIHIDVKNVMVKNPAFYLGKKLQKLLPFYEHILIVDCTSVNYRFDDSTPTNIADFSMNTNGIFYQDIISKLSFISTLENAVLDGFFLLEGEHCILPVADHITAFLDFKKNIEDAVINKSIKTLSNNWYIMSPKIPGLQDYFNSITTLSNEKNLKIVSGEKTAELQSDQTYFIIETNGIYVTYDNVTKWIDAIIDAASPLITNNHRTGFNSVKIILQILKTHLLATSFVFIILFIISVATFVLLFLKKKGKTIKLNDLIKQKINRVKKV